MTRYLILFYFTFKLGFIAFSQNKPVYRECGNEDKDFPADKSYEATVKIGSQFWKTHNLDVVTFSNGDTIPEAKTKEEWINAGDSAKPAWCYYNNDPKNGKDYGKLYNWYVIHDPRGIAPKGFHVPTADDWEVLIENLGGDSLAGKKMRMLVLWQWPKEGLETSITGSSGFAARPGGMRSNEGEFIGLSQNAYFFGFNQDLADADEWGCMLSYDHSYFVRSLHNAGGHGFSIRCVRD